MATLPDPDLHLIMENKKLMRDEPNSSYERCCIKKELLPNYGLVKKLPLLDKVWDHFFYLDRNSLKSVNFKNNSISDKGIADVLKELIVGLKSYYTQASETFDFNLSWSRGITNESLKTIGSVLKRHLSGLKNLSLAFYMCANLDDRGLQIFGDDICRGLPNLHSLLLNFSRCPKVTDISLETLSSQITNNLFSLSELKLNFSGCEKITDESLIYMAARFGKIQKLHLQFMRCDGITDNGFGQITRHLFNTKELILDFTGCTGITDKGMTSFACQTNPLLSKLDHLSLHFSECKNITDSGLEVIAKQFFKKLTNLKELVLNFSKNQKISDDSLELLTNHIIEDMPKIEKLSLDFHTCDLSNRGLEKLGKQIQTSLNHIKKLRLNFSVIARISSKAKEDLRKQVDFIQDFYMN